MARLILLRHGEIEMGRTRHLCGSSDEPLNAEGLRQIDRLAQRLTGAPVDAVYSSDLQRAWATAEAVAAAHRIDVVACPEMREMDFGECEGLTFQQVEKRFPDVARMWLARSPDLQYPGGEKVTDFAKRVEGFGMRLQQHKENETVVLAAHLGSLRMLLCHLLGIRWQHWWQFQLDYASLSALETRPAGLKAEDSSSMLITLNDTSHLGIASAFVPRFRPPSSQGGVPPGKAAI